LKLKSLKVKPAVNTWTADSSNYLRMQTLWSAMEFWQLSCGKLQNFTKWPTEFGKIFCRKLWAY